MNLLKFDSDDILMIRYYRHNEGYESILKQ
jgi:hypothetical protein